MLAGCSKPPDKSVAIQAGMPADNQAIIKAALKQLMATCIGLNQRSYDLINWHATVASSGNNPYNYHTEDWGWKKWVEVTVEVRTNARDLPSEWNAKGQVLKYDLGGGEQPGIDGKTPCRNSCAAHYRSAMTRIIRTPFCPSRNLSYWTKLK